MIWLDDLLDRQADARFLIDFVTQRVEEKGEVGEPRSYVINLDTQWGQGKTFFLTRLEQQLTQEGHLAVYVNAWKDDHADTPLIAIVAQIDDTLKPFLKGHRTIQKLWSIAKDNSLEIAAQVGKGVLKQLIKKHAGDVIENITEAISSNESEQPTDQNHSADAIKAEFEASIEAVVDRAMAGSLDRFRSVSKSNENFKKQLSALLAKMASGKIRRMPMFVLVDELDRCRPTYAITLLEQVKHLFDIDNLVFVIATDSDQLHHSITAIYGAGFDSRRYLRRFFDRTYAFGAPEPRAFVEHLFRRYQIDPEKLSSPPESPPSLFFTEAMNYFHLTLRDTEQCFDVLRTAITLWRYPVPLEMLYLIPLIVAHHHGDKDYFASLESLQPRATSLKFGSTEASYRANPWTFDFGDTDDRRKHKRIVFLDLLDRLASLASKPLPEIDDVSSPLRWERWIRDRFRFEFQKIHGNRYDPSAPPRSLLRIYPTLVRNAAKLSEPSN